MGSLDAIFGAHWDHEPVRCTDFSRLGLAIVPQIPTKVSTPNALQSGEEWQWFERFMVRIGAMVRLERLRMQLLFLEICPARHGFYLGISGRDGQTGRCSRASVKRGIFPMQRQTPRITEARLQQPNQMKEKESEP
jgi:hypothetical protein